MSQVKHSFEDHETKIGDGDGGADIVGESKAGQRNFLNKFPKLRIQLRC